MCFVLTLIGSVKKSSLVVSIELRLEGFHSEEYNKTSIVSFTAISVTLLEISRIMLRSRS